MSSKSSPLGGSLVIAAGRLVSSFSGLVLIWLIARRGPEDLGVFRTLFSFFLITELFPLLGLQIYFMREISIDRSHVRKYLLHSVVFALAVSVVVALVLLGLAKWGGYSPSVSQGLLVISGAMPATALYLCAMPVLIGLEKGATIGVLQAIETLGRTTLAAIFVLLGWPMLAVIFALVATRWAIIVAYWRALKPPPDPAGWRFEPAFLRQILAQVPVFAGITIFAAITRFAAPLILPWMLNDQAAGQFGAAYIFVDIAVLLPTALVANLMPRFSLLARDSVDQISRAAQEGIKLMALGMLPVAGLVTLLAQPLLALIFHNPEIYLTATPVLQISIWICFFMAVDQVLSATIVACGKQRYDLQSVAIGAIAILTLVCVAISKWGVRGAAIGLVTGYAIQVCARLVLFAPHVPGLNLLRLIWRPLLATAVMMGTIGWIPLHYWILAAGAGAVVYLLLLLALGSLRAAECDGIGLLLRLRKT